jgi:hypothetical protein
MNYNVKEGNPKDLISKSVPMPNAIDPSEGVRLIKAFLEIKEQGRREKLIRLAEDMARLHPDAASAGGLQGKMLSCSSRRRTTQADNHR